VKLNFGIYLVRGEVSLLSTTAPTLILTQYEMSESTPVMSKVKGAFQVRQMTSVRFALVRLLTAKKSVVSAINNSNSLMSSRCEVSGSTEH